MSTTAELKTRTAKDLAQAARKKGVRGWHSMRKDQLIKALVRLANSKAEKRSNSNKTKRSAAAKPAAKSVAKKTRTAYMARRIRRTREELTRAKDLALACQNAHCNGSVKDRLVVLVRDPYWLQAYWEFTRATIDRAKAALGQLWHGAKPILRVAEVSRNGTTSSAQRVLRDIEIHGGVNNWYIDVADPPNSYRLEIGYLAATGKFFCLSRSNVVTTPRPGATDSLDGNWAAVADDCERIYAMSGGYGQQGAASDLKDLFEERLRRPMGSPMVTRFGLGAGGLSGRRRDFSFEVEAELIVSGTTESDAYVTVKGEPVRLRPDGTFSVRLNLPDCRQVLPVVASSGDGVEQRTIVLAVERNTKVMETVIRDPSE